jgi:hypothetical protein
LRLCLSEFLNVFLNTREDKLRRHSHKNLRGSLHWLAGLLEVDENQHGPNIIELVCVES